MKSYETMKKQTSNARKTLESQVISGMIESNIPFLRISHADTMVPAMMKAIFHDKATAWAVQEYLEEIKEADNG